MLSCKYCSVVYISVVMLFYGVVLLWCNKVVLINRNII